MIAIDNATKALMRPDESNFYFTVECLGPNAKNYAINLDRIMWDGAKFYIFEFQKCSLEAQEKGITPHNSHPHRYWDRCRRKYLAIWRMVQTVGAAFYVVNYSEKGTPCEDQVRWMRVDSMDETGFTKQEDRLLTREEFAKWFRNLNEHCGNMRGASA